MTTDRDLQESVLRALEYEPGLDAAKIGVSVAQGIVTLQGAVKTYFHKLTAERVAQHVFGVRAVANDLTVLPEGRHVRTDSEIADAALSALHNHTAVPINTIRVSVDNGWITLSGHLPWQFQKVAAERAVRYLHGVTGVINTIVVKTMVSPTDVKAKIEGAFRRSADVEAQRVAVEAHDGAVTLLVTVKSLSERREAERAAWSAPGVSLVDNRLVVAP